MFMVCIKLLGEVTFAYPTASARGYSYDVPQDWLGIPYISPSEIFSERKLPGVKMRRAHPDGYFGLMRTALELQRVNKDSTAHIGSFFTQERLDKKSMKRICSLKAGQTFFASVEFDKDKYEELETFLRGIKRIGVEREGISGEVKCSLESVPQNDETTDFSAQSTYCALDYSLRLISPVCFHAPYNSEQSYLYAPGSIIRKDLCKKILPNVAEKLKITNAYIMDENERLLPMPLCMSVVKLDQEQLRYRLADGKKSRLPEQVVNVSNAYTADFEAKMVRYVRPEIVRVTSAAGKMYDALAEGQTLLGTIYGPDEELRKLATHIGRDKFFSIGNLTEEGYGEVYLQVIGLREEKPKAEMLARRFDVACLSDVLIINDDAMPGYNVENLLAETERLLNAPDKLTVEENFTDVQKDLSLNEEWGQEGSVLRCLKAGSVVRFRTKNNEPVDIAPILHAFVGERTADGYGEITAYPAREGYYRLAKNLEPVKLATELRLSTRDINFGAKLSNHVLLSFLKKRVKFLALIDKSDYQAGLSVSELLPTPIFDYLRNEYCPDLSPEIMERWYRESLEEKEDVGDFA